MTWFERFINDSQLQMNQPKPFGLFHLAFIVLTAAFTVFLCLKYRDASDKVLRKILFFSWLVVFILEVFKQVLVSFHYTDGEVTWKYFWGEFPFQLCSAQLYLLPLAAFLKEGKVRQAVMSCMAGASFVGGLTVYVFASSVFVETVFLNLQTMIHHGVQIALGIYIAVYYRKELGWRFLLRGEMVFFVLLSLAIAFNVIAPTFTEDAVNMFYMSPYSQNSIPLLDDFMSAIPYPIFVLGYSSLIFAVSLTMQFAVKKIYEKLLEKEKGEGITVSETV